MYYMFILKTEYYETDLLILYVTHDEAQISSDMQKN